MSSPNLEVHIEELVLDGFGHVDRTRIGAVVQAELVRLFAERGVSTSLLRSGSAANLHGGDFNVEPNATAEAIGAQIAQAVYRGFE